MDLVFQFFLDLSERYWDICKKQFLGTSWMGWRPVDWVGRVLPEAKFVNKWTLFFSFFFIWATDTEISVENSIWRPVERVGNQLNGLGTSWLVLPESKFENKWTKFFEFFDLSDRYWDFCKKQFLGTSWMGWGPVEWVGGQLTGPPRIKIPK